MASGRAVITPVDAKGKPILTEQLEVLVVGRQERFVSFFLATDSSNFVFGPANIGFVLHNVVHVNLSVNLVGRAKDIADFSKRRRQIVEMGPKRPDVVGHTSGRNIILEDSGTEIALAHEMGHALGLPHNKVGNALMFETASGSELVREDILKIGLLG